MNHRAYVGIGSNLGDRRTNILAALQRLRACARIESVSEFYESAAADGAEGPPFLNVAAALEIDDDRETFERHLREIERAMGRTTARRLAARPIDIDLLAFDAWEHPQLSERPYNLVPLAEVAPAYAARAQHRNGGAIRRLEHGLRFHTDRQEEVPEVRISLGRAGICDLRRVLNVEIDGRPQVVSAELTMVADLSRQRSGVHMSRFVESFEEAVLDVLAREERPRSVDALVASLATDIVATQEATHAEVRLRAGFSLERWTPVSGKRGQEGYTLVTIAHASESTARSVIGVEADGMTACPCAQDMMREHSLHSLQEAGFSRSEAERVLATLPAVTHNQRGRGSLLIGAAGEARCDIRIEDLVEIVESSMSSETYDLLKRPDEFFVVNKAHRHPKFVEDVVRAIVARTLETYAALGDDAFVFASQQNQESIHKHDAFAQTYGTFGEFRAELSGIATRKTEMAAWLSRGSPDSRYATSATDAS
jgi:GTP cyclohydrolase IV